MNVLKVEIKTEPLQVSNKRNLSHPYRSFFVNNYGKECEITDGCDLSTMLPIQVIHYEIVNLSYPMLTATGVEEVIKRFLVPVNDLGLFQQLYHVDKALLDSLINAKSKQEYELGERVGKRLGRDEVRELPLWKRLLKKF